MFEVIRSVTVYPRSSLLVLRGLWSLKSWSDRKSTHTHTYEPRPESSSQPLSRRHRGAGEASGQGQHGGRLRRAARPGSSRRTGVASGSRGSFAGRSCTDSGAQPTLLHTGRDLTNFRTGILCIAGACVCVLNIAVVSDPKYLPTLEVAPLDRLLYTNPPRPVGPNRSIIEGHRTHRIRTQFELTAEEHSMCCVMLHDPTP